jgi:hypothetical protein
VAGNGRIDFVKKGQFGLGNVASTKFLHIGDYTEVEVCFIFTVATEFDQFCPSGQGRVRKGETRTRLEMNNDHDLEQS